MNWVSSILGPRVESSRVKEKKEREKENEKGKGTEKEKREEAKRKEAEGKKRSSGSSGRKGKGSQDGGKGDDPDRHILYVEGYAGYLAPMILTLSQTSGRSPVIISGALAILFMAVHLALPIFMVAHYSCLLTLIVPGQSTLRLISAELHPPKRPRTKESEPKPPEEDPKDEDEDHEKQDAYEDAHDSWEKRDEKRRAEEERYKENKDAKVAAGQWLLYWLLYTGASLARGYVGIVRPGWKGWFEVWRTVVLIIAAGPWFSPSALM